MSSTRNKKNKPVRKPREFGKITYKGNLKLFVKYNAKSDKSFVQCISNVTVKNKVIGDFYLKKGKIYKCLFETKGLKSSLTKDNIWIAYRNMPNIISDSLIKRIKYISKNI